MYIWIQAAVNVFKKDASKNNFNRNNTPNNEYRHRNIEIQI